MGLIASIANSLTNLFKTKSDNHYDNDFDDLMNKCDLLYSLKIVDAASKGESSIYINPFHYYPVPAGWKEFHKRKFIREFRKALIERGFTLEGHNDWNHQMTYNENHDFENIKISW